MNNNRKGWTRVEIQTNGKKISFEIETSGLYNLNFGGYRISSLDKIYGVFITDNMVFLMKQDPVFRDGALFAPAIKEDRRINCVDAYDRKGVHLWNIGDIVGDIKFVFQSTWLTTRDELISSGILPNDVDCSFDILASVAEGFLYYIDPIQKKILKIVTGIK
ncbi:MAG: hypothetical protein IJX74_00435 [Clostridia bacterium]|nr:hypothetical protein [Clostridia bacterium]